MATKMARRHDELVAALRERPGATAVELAQARGEGPATVRMALAQMVGDGRVRRWRVGGEQWKYEAVDPDARHVLDP